MPDSIVMTEAVRTADNHAAPDHPIDWQPEPQPELSDATLVRLYQQFGLIAALAVVLVSLIILLGWAAGIPVLTSAHPAWVHAKVNTAIGFLALGIALSVLVSRHRRGDPPPMTLVVVCIGVAMSIGVASLLEDVFNLGFGMDQIIIAEAPGATETLHPGRPGSIASACFIMMGLALLVPATGIKRLNGLMEAFSITTLVVSMAAFIGYVLGVRELYTLAGHTTAIGFLSAISALLLAVGTLCATSDHAVFRHLASAGSGGFMLRRLLPLVALVITTVVALRLWAQAAGLFDTLEFGAATVAVTSIVGMGAILIWCAGRLDRLDRARAAAEARVQQLNASLRKKVTDLAAANEELESFAYSVSHDLQAPLRAIDGFSRILAEDYADRLDPEAQRIIGVVRDGTQQMAQLIQDILKFSRIGRTDMATRPVDMNELIQDLLRELAPSIGVRNVRFTVGTVPSAYGDQMMLRRVWQNLLDNAIKYTSTQDAAVIEVGSTARHAEVAYYVKENGVGFDMRFVGKLFGMFRRLHRSDEFPGTGIGLAIVKRIIARHGGTVGAEGTPGQGAIFRFTLPSREVEHA